MGRLRALLNGVREWFARLPAWVTVAVAAAALAVTAVAGVMLYRTYDYVQHDNDFCLSCHLMRDPYERFAESAHRDLGCKACHQPTLITRSTMALTQILEQPESLVTHAEVPSERCVECHVEGDPEQWLLISNSAGHSVHLESDDPSLQGLGCVECHSTSIHEFAPTDRTCGQAGCHENVEIRLGEMANLTIHCAACHEFSRPLTDPVLASKEGASPLQPRRDECLSCHAMRTLTADMPPDEPHEGACGACHNPHEQTTPAEAVESCATAGCHTRPDTLTPMHRGLDVGVLENCTACHDAHTFRVESEPCLACHMDIFREPPVPVGRTTAAAAPAASSAPLARLAAVSLHAPAEDAAVRAVFVQDPRGRAPLTFSHLRHRDVGCQECHSSERVHGALTISGPRECQECHHTAPVASNCATCHAPGELGGVYRVRQTLRMSVGAETRGLPFAHSPHAGVSCTSCHREPVTLQANVSCSGCHQQHHETDNSCLACHTEPAAGAHDLESHLSCAGSGCHTSLPFQGVPRTREVCLSCHQDLVRHFPARSCVACHRLPPPTQGAGAGRGAER